MYTLVMFACLSTAPDTAGFGGGLRDRIFGNCNGCTGCTGCSGCNGSTSSAMCYGTCSGSCYGSCTGSSYACYGSCHGSCQGSCHGGFGSRLRAFFNRSESCYGSCHGRSYACYGSCSGLSCQGGFPPMPGDSYPSYPTSPMGGDFAPPLPTTSYAVPSDGGCTTCGVPLGSPTPVGYGVSSYPVTATPLAPIAPIAPVRTTPPTIRTEPPVIEESRNLTRALATGSSPARASVVVKLPADAKLFAEGRPLALESGERAFVTPVLPAGREFEYTFRAEYKRDGETISQTKKVAVRAGGKSALEFVDLTAARQPAIETRGSESPRVDLTSRTPATATTTPTTTTPSTGNPFLGGTVSQTPAVPQVPQMPTGPGTLAKPERARISVRVPAGVTLYIDGTRNNRTELVRDFTTPPLPVGQEFAYTMKAEWVRNGQPESQTQRITLRAGEIVTVDFSR